MVAGFSRAVGVDRTAVHEAWRILFRRRGALCRAKAFPVSSQAFGHADLSATAPCRASASCADNLPVVIPRLDALRAGDDAVHTVEGKKVRLLIVAAEQDRLGEALPAAWKIESEPEVKIAIAQVIGAAAVGN